MIHSVQALLQKGVYCTLTNGPRPQNHPTPISTYRDTQHRNSLSAWHVSAALFVTSSKNCSIPHSLNHSSSWYQVQLTWSHQTSCSHQQEFFLSQGTCRTTHDRSLVSDRLCMKLFPRCLLWNELECYSAQVYLPHQTAAVTKNTLSMNTNIPQSTSDKASHICY